MTKNLKMSVVDLLKYFIKKNAIRFVPSAAGMCTINLQLYTRMIPSVKDISSDSFITAKATVLIRVLTNSLLLEAKKAIVCLLSKKISYHDAAFCCVFFCINVLYLYTTQWRFYYVQTFFYSACTYIMHHLCFCRHYIEFSPSLLLGHSSF